MNFVPHFRNVIAATLVVFLLATLVPGSALAAVDPQTVAGSSENWAGYVAKDNFFTGVGGSWTVPTPKIGSQNDLAADVTWVGIGGLNTKDLIQAGTQAVVQNGAIQYQAWYEALPGSQQMIPALVVQGGDSVSVDLIETSKDTWRLTFKNYSTGTQYNTDIHYVSSHSSADWIEEMPLAISDTKSGYLPLDQFGTVQINNAYAIINGRKITAGGTGAIPLTMYSRTAILAQPSSLGNDYFSVTRTSAQIVTTFSPTRRGVHRTGSDTNGYVRSDEPPAPKPRTSTTYTYTGPGYQIVQVIWSY